jgi:hypothetical protein
MKIILSLAMFFALPSIAQTKVTQIGKLAGLSKRIVKEDVYDCRYQYVYAYKRVAGAAWRDVFFAELKALSKKIHDGDDSIDIYRVSEIRSESQIRAQMVTVLKSLNEGQSYTMDEDGIEWANPNQLERGRLLIERAESLAPTKNRSFYAIQARFAGADGANDMWAVADDKTGEFAVVGMSSIDNGCF